MNVVGIDLAPAMLALARTKAAGTPNARFIEGDMRSFRLKERFPLAIMPGHAFQYMLAVQDQIACLERVREHLLPGGRLVVHVVHPDIAWLGKLRSGRGGIFEAPGEIAGSGSSLIIRTARAWRYEPATQTASSETVWEEIEPGGTVVRRWERGPVLLHCVFRFEMEHLLSRMGFAVEGVYGDFFRGALKADSSEMIWVARKPE